MKARIENQRTNRLLVAQLIETCLHPDVKQVIKNKKNLGKPRKLVKCLENTYLENKDENKEALEKEFEKFKRNQGDSFQDMIQRITILILECENADIEITNEQKVKKLLRGIGIQSWAQTILTIQQIAEDKNWDFEWAKKDLLKKEKALREIMNLSQSAHIAQMYPVSVNPTSAPSPIICSPFSVC